MRIIVDEDKIPLNNAISKILQQAGYAVDQAFDGQDALDLIDGHYHDLIILDLTLPYIDGLEVIKNLRDKKIWTPILVLTARGTVPDIVKGLKSGADDYLPKPFEVEELLARAQALMRRRANQPGPKLEVGDLQLDPNSHEVVRKGQTISLSKTEFQLLYYLMRKSPQIATKEEILTHVWQNETAVYDRVVDTYICFLRKKIDKAFPNLEPLIHTVKTHGYKIVSEK